MRRFPARRRRCTVCCANKDGSASVLADTIANQNVERARLTLHADSGCSMASKLVAFLLADLGVTKSHSGPHCSNDNPYSESQFKTLTYRRDKLTGPAAPARVRHDPERPGLGGGEMSSSTGRALAGLLILVDMGLLMWTIMLGFHIEGTAAAVADAERGQSIAIPAGASLVCALYALVAARRPSGRWVLTASVALLVTAAIVAAVTE